MKKYLLKIGEITCVIILAVFIFFISSQEKLSTTPFEQVKESVSSVCDLDGLKKADKLKLKKQFAFDADSFKSFSYTLSDSVMDVRELLIISLDNTEQQDSVVDVLEKYVTEKQQLFEGYAPEQSNLLASHVLIASRGYVLFYVGKDTEKVSSAFQQIL